MNPIGTFGMSRRSPAQREWDALRKKERRFLEQRQKKSEPAFHRLIAEKIPDKLQDTLNRAFEKAFSVVFEKGAGVIEKTYRREEIEKDFRISLYADEVYGSPKSLKAFSKKAGRASSLNLALSGISGVGMGFFGIGLPEFRFSPP